MEPTLNFESSSFLFEPGRVYNRRQDLHGEYGGQHQGGISTPADYDLIFLFTSESGSEYGYKDEFRPDGTFWYTGEGQKGDTEMVRGDRALRNQSAMVDSSSRRAAGTCPSGVYLASVGRGSETNSLSAIKGRSDLRETSCRGHL